MFITLPIAKIPTTSADPGSFVTKVGVNFLFGRVGGLARFPTCNFPDYIERSYAPYCHNDNTLFVVAVDDYSVHLLKNFAHIDYLCVPHSHTGNI